MPQPKPAVAEPVEPAEAPAKGRAPVAKASAPKPKAMKGRTVYIPDDLFERILVQAHRKDRTISEYVCGLLERHVPDHRRVGPALATESGEGEAAA